MIQNKRQIKMKMMLNEKDEGSNYLIGMNLEEIFGKITFKILTF